MQDMCRASVLVTGRLLFLIEASAKVRSEGVKGAFLDAG